MFDQIHIIYIYYFYVVSKGAFSIGLKFDYWSKYKDKENKELNEMYVEKKYDNFQAEIYQYQHEMEDIKTFKNEVMVKVNEYINSAVVKSTSCPVNWYEESEEYPYGIPRGATMSKNHLISIILYTDYTQLSSDFTSTFRKHGAFDSLQAAKKRNQKYWWWSKTLLEAVRAYGDAYSRRAGGHAGIDRWCIDGGALKGPFYSGMSMVLNIPEFNIRLISPTSTSLHIEVAMKFSGEQGIIIELNNDKVGHYTQALDVSWISRFAEEEERYSLLDFFFVYSCVHNNIIYRLFYGNDKHPINITSIRMIESSLNFEYLVGAMTALDNCISNQIRNEVSASHKYGEKLSVLFNYIINGKLEKKWNKYVYDTFHCFTRNKQIIHISVGALKLLVKDKDLLNLICYKLDDNNFEIIDEENLTNLIRPHLFKIFENVQEIYVETFDYGLYLFGLLSIIKNTKIKKATITATTPSWINNIWSSHEQQIVDKFDASNFDVQFKQKPDEDEDLIIIVKK